MGTRITHHATLALTPALTLTHWTHTPSAIVIAIIIEVIGSRDRFKNRTREKKRSEKRWRERKKRAERYIEREKGYREIERNKGRLERKSINELTI